MKTRIFISALVSVVTIGAVAFASACSSPENLSSPKVGEAAPGFTAVDSNGNEINLADYAGKYVVLEWSNFGCPFVKKHYDSGNMQDLQTRWTAEEVVWLSVVSSAPGKQGHYPPEEMNAEFTSRNASPSAIIMDEDGSVGQAYGARTTPHMFVIDPQGTLIYMGAIDDKPTTDQEDVEGAVNYVSAALEASMAGNFVEVTVTKPYGCNVKY